MGINLPPLWLMHGKLQDAPQRAQIIFLFFGDFIDKKNILTSVTRITNAIMKL